MMVCWRFRVWELRHTLREAAGDGGRRGAQVRLRVPDIEVAMESREFEILQDAITHVCLAPVRLACLQSACNFESVKLWSFNP